MHRFLWFAVLAVIALTLACGEEKEPADTETAAPDKTPQQLAEEKAPIAVDNANVLLTAIQTGDKAKVLDMCFRDPATVAEAMGFTEQEVADSQAQQKAQLALFEGFWNDMLLSGAYVIQGWTEPAIVQIGPAEGHPELVIYVTQTDVDYVLNGKEQTEAGKAVVIFNLGDEWFAQWPY
jgi:hypothetical protein